MNLWEPQEPREPQEPKGITGTQGNHRNPRNQVVLKKDFTCKKTKGGKLKERYLGPYTITKVLPSPWNIRACWSIRQIENLCATGAHLKPYTTHSPPHEENVSGKGISKEECSEIKDEAFTLSPHPEDESSENKISLLPPNEDEAFITTQGFWEWR